ncbi:MAG: ComEC/Rec2 family competence protein [Opitutaceae bacterium]
MTSRSLGHRAPLLWLVLPLIAGIAVGRYGPAGQVEWLLAGAGFSTLLALVAAWIHPRFWAWPLCGALFLAGDASYTLRRARLAAWEHLPPREVRLGLRVDRVFPQTEAGKCAGLATVKRSETHLPDLVGQRIYFSASLARGNPTLIRSEMITATGVLTPLPENPSGTSFDGYLADAGMNFRLARGRVLGVDQPPTPYREFCEHLSRKLNAILSAGVTAKRPALAAIYRAMMLGQKSELSIDQDQLFVHSGTMHLFAISGLHIGVVAAALHALLLLARCPRPVVAGMTLLVLWINVDVTGASPSAIRAWLLVAAAEIAFALRLRGNGVAALTTAALLMLLAEPMTLFSASFQMSYGVVLALLCFGLPLAERLAERWPPWPHLPEVTWTWWQRWVASATRWFWPVFGIGVAAWLVGTVAGAAFYGVITPGSLLANLVLVPMAMVVIVAGFTSSMLGLAGWVSASAFLNHAAVLVLMGIDALIRLGERVPGAWWPAQWRAPWLGTATLVALLAVVLAGYANGWRGWSRFFWPPFAVVALALIFGVKFG